MKLTILYLFGVFTPFGVKPAPAQDALSAVLARMDKNAESFQGMTGTLTELNHNDIIGDDEVQTAAVRMKRSKFGIFGRVDFSGQNARTVSIRDRKLQVYYPAGHYADVWDVGKYGDQLDQFLLLGFSTSGKQLDRDYKIKLLGTETVGGEMATHLDLTPKSKEARDMFQKAELWLALDATRPIKEKIYKNGQDFTVITYSAVKVNPNPPLSDKDVEFALPPNTNVNYPQKQK